MIPRRTRAQRVASLAAKRPPITVELERVPRPGLRDQLVDLLIELLDEHGRGHSGGG